MLPLYEKIKQTIVSKIESGDLKPSDRLPSEHELTVQYNVSRMTVNRALRELQNEGFIQRIPGLGSFVSEFKVEGHFLEIRSIADEIRERGHLYSATILEVEKVKAPERIFKWMNIKPNTRIFHSIIIHYEHNLPLQYEDRYVNPEIAPDYNKVDFTVTTPSEYLMKVAPLQRVEHKVKAIRAEKEICKHLKMGLNEPCLMLWRRTWAINQIASVATLYHPGSRYELSDQFSPETGLSDSG